ncbi:MAG: CAP domain-containing protein [Verrucomicrobiota bacterium]
MIITPPVFRFILLFAIFLATLQARAANLPAETRERASELFKALQSNSDDFEKRSEIVEEMTTLGRPVTEILLKQLKKEWEPLYEKYFSDYSETAALIADEKRRGETKKEAEELAEEVRSLRKVDNLTEDMIRSKGTPAMKRLREITRVIQSEVLAKSEELYALRARVVGIGQEIAHCEEELLVDVEEATGFSEAEFSEKEKTIADNAISMDRAHKTVLESNEKIAIRKEVPAAEAEGVRDLNALRLLIGLDPLALDPKLCDASRIHSEDMAKQGFFAHDSPVKGHETPWKRAKVAGTTASAENIYSGSKKPKVANQAWFYSPGHHKNMFGDHKRAGMGLFNNKWTQLFGR